MKWFYSLEGAQFILIAVLALLAATVGILLIIGFRDLSMLVFIFLGLSVLHFVVVAIRSFKDD